MITLRMKVSYLFRKKEPLFHSIESVFVMIIPLVGIHFKTERLELHYDYATPNGIRKNLRQLQSDCPNRLFHITGHVNYMALRTGRMSVLTIHDIRSALKGNFLARFIKLIFWFWFPALIVKRITVISEFSRKELAPEREENDKFPYGPFFSAILKKAYNLDFFHSILPETYGGIGQGMNSLCIVLENICREDSSLGGIILTNSAAHEILLFSEDAELLNKVVSGPDSINDFLIAFPVFNNSSESEIKVQAKKEEKGYTLNGSLEYLVLGGIAKHALIPATVEGTDGYTYFLIDLEEKGVEVSKPIHSLGLHACPAVDLTLNKVKGSLVGKEGEGHLYFDKMVSRLSVAAASMASGIMKGSFKEALDYTKKRHQGGRAIINWSEIRMILSNMAITIKNAEMTVSSACQAMEGNENGWEDCSRAAAIQIQDMACSLTTDGIQVMGGVGYMKDFGQEKRFRDAKHIQTLFGITPLKKLKYLEGIL